ncbi:MAG: hypothetical protein V1789_12015 [PVC group bacterium]
MNGICKKAAIGMVCLLAVIVIAGCAAGPASRFAEHPAGFWAGLWHGLICIVTFVISLFTKNVQMYEINNTGGWYNFGFLLGVCIIFGGSWGAGCKRKSPAEVEWDEIGEKLERKVRRGIKSWLDEDEDKKDSEEWEAISRQIEEKIKRELRDWAEK